MSISTYALQAGDVHSRKEQKDNDADGDNEVEGAVCQGVTV